jgi:hypothetical protein
LLAFVLIFVKGKIRGACLGYTSIVIILYMKKIEVMLFYHGL